ncbi:MAG: hypothetical protein HY690_17700 [Chloroflexi bacterium]|nr:hypothetical protein [Chloroflexota bacterium]
MNQRSQGSQTYRARLAATFIGLSILAVACAPAQPAAPASRPAQPQPAASNPQPAGQGSQAAGPVRIREIANAFFPKSIAVKGGTTVHLQIENQDGVNHNLVAIGDIGLKPSEQDPNTATEVDWAVPSRPGTYKVICAYHPGMELGITVE